MNYKPFAGFWCYGGVNASQRATFFSSWGLISQAPEPIIPSVYTKIAPVVTEYIKSPDICFTNVNYVDIAPISLEYTKIAAIVAGTTENTTDWFANKWFEHAWFMGGTISTGSGWTKTTSSTTSWSKL